MGLTRFLEGLPIAVVRYVFQAKATISFGLHTSHKMRREFERSYRFIVTGNMPFRDSVSAAPVKDLFDPPRSTFSQNVPPPPPIIIDSPFPEIRETSNEGEFFVDTILCGEALHRSLYIGLAWQRLFGRGFGKPENVAEFVRAEAMIDWNVFAPANLEKTIPPVDFTQPGFSTIPRPSEFKLLFVSPLVRKHELPSPGVREIAEYIYRGITNYRAYFGLSPVEPLTDDFADTVIEYSNLKYHRLKIPKIRESGFLNKSAISGEINVSYAPNIIGDILAASRFIRPGSMLSYGMGRIILEPKNPVESELEPGPPSKSQYI